MKTIDDLADGSLYYLATPYQSHPEGMTEAYKVAAITAARMIERGVMVYSPIAHGHPIATLGGLGRGSDVWGGINDAVMTACLGVVIAEMPGWDKSPGIADERDLAERLCVSVWLMDKHGHLTLLPHPDRAEEAA